MGAVLAGIAMLGIASSVRSRVCATERSSDDLRSLLDEVVPFIVHTNIVNSRSLRSCGSSSALFEHLAKKSGFCVTTTSRPGHFFNLVKTSDGTLEIDLTNIQFSCKLQEPFRDDDHAAWSKYDDDFGKLMNRLIKNPFDAITVKNVGGPEVFDAVRWKSESPFDQEADDDYSEQFSRYKRLGYRVPRHLR